MLSIVSQLVWLRVASGSLVWAALCRVFVVCRNSCVLLCLLESLLGSSCLVWVMLPGSSRLVWVVLLRLYNSLYNSLPSRPCLLLLLQLLRAW